MARASDGRCCIGSKSGRTWHTRRERAWQNPHDRRDSSLSFIAEIPEMPQYSMCSIGDFTREVLRWLKGMLLEHTLLVDKKEENETAEGTLLLARSKAEDLLRKKGGRLGFSSVQFPLTLRLPF